MQNQLEQVLRDVGPCLSSVAATQLRQRFNLTESAARQRIARREFPVRSLEGLPFSKGQSFLFLANDFQSQKFFHALTAALERNNGAYARTIQALGARGGIMPLRHLASAAALADTPGQLSAQVLVERLVKAEVLAELDVPGEGACVGFRATVELDDSIAQMKARLKAEDLLLAGVKDWARNLALGSFELFNVRGGDRPPSVGRFEWDMTAPSYISGLTTWNAAAGKPNPGFLITDVLLGRSSVDERGIAPFVYKCDTLRRTGKARCMQVFLAEGFTHEALLQVRRCGAVPGRLDELFGRDVAKALKELIATLTQTAAQAADLEKFDFLFTSLGRFEGAAGRLRGALFEFVAAKLLEESGWLDVVINKLYRENGKDLAEVDVRARKEDVVLFVECKGITPGTVLDDDEVKTWLEKRVPAVAGKARQNSEYDGCQLVFELWTSGELSPQARAMVAAKQQVLRPAKYTVDVRFGRDLHGMALRHKRRQPTLAKVLEQHYVTSPLSEVKMLVPASPPQPPDDYYGSKRQDEFKLVASAEVDRAFAALTKGPSGSGGAVVLRREGGE